MSRSEMYTRALREFLDEKQTTHITERLNQVYEEASSVLDPVLVRQQAASLSVEEW
jgi:metal-responsive CopG/Arc/MetJ family transcriptional regulator